MSTAIGFECDGGAVLAVDRGLVRDGRVVSRDRRRLFDADDLGVTGTHEAARADAPLAVAVVGGEVAGSEATETSVASGDGVKTGGEPRFTDDPERLRRELGGELRSYALDRGPPSLEPLTNLLVDLAADVGVDVVLAARDEDGRARVRAVLADGTVVDDDVVAVGTGSDLALGGLEGLDREVDPDEVAARARELLGDVAARDVATGEAVDVWTLRDG